MVSRKLVKTILVAILIFITACTTQPEEIVETKMVQITESPEQTDANTYKVLFRVTGTATKAKINLWDDRSGENLFMEVFDIPYEQSMDFVTLQEKVDFFTELNLTLSVTNLVDYPGSLECDIWIDGKKTDSESLGQIQDGLSMVSCSVIP